MARVVVVPREVVDAEDLAVEQHAQGALAPEPQGSFGRLLRV